jgi:hypothetical protein
MEDLLKKFSDQLPETNPRPNPPPLAKINPTHERKLEIKFPHPDKSRHVSTTVGHSSHLRGRVGRKDRIR